jgi:hypothetical protein
MIRVFNKLLNGNTLFPIQNAQRVEHIPLEATVPAGNQEKLAAASVSFIGHFLCQYITGSFETLYSTGGHTVDDGVCHLRAKLVDSSGSIFLFSDYAPLDLFLSPGRRRSTTAENNLTAVAGTADKADNAPSLFWPLDEEYLFTAKSEIQVFVKNDSNVDLKFALLFKGIRIYTPGK